MTGTSVITISLFIVQIQNTVCARGKQRDVCLFVGCLMSQQHAGVSQGRICSDNFTCCHTWDRKWQYTDTEPTSPSTDPIMPGAWQSSHWSANFKVTGMTQPWKNPGACGIQTGIFRSWGGDLNHYTNEAVSREKSVSCPILLQKRFGGAMCATMSDSKVSQDVQVHNPVKWHAWLWLLFLSLLSKHKTKSVPGVSREKSVSCPLLLKIKYFGVLYK